MLDNSRPLLTQLFFPINVGHTVPYCAKVFYQAARPEATSHKPTEIEYWCCSLLCKSFYQAVRPEAASHKPTEIEYWYRHIGYMFIL